MLPTQDSTCLLPPWDPPSRVRGSSGPPGRAGSCILSPSVLYHLINDVQGDKNQGWLSGKVGGREEEEGGESLELKTSKPTNVMYFHFKSLNLVTRVSHNIQKFALHHFAFTEDLR